MTFDQKISRARFTGHEVPSHKIIKTPAQIEGIRESYSPYFARAAIPSVRSTITMMITVAAIKSTETADTVGS